MKAQTFLPKDYRPAEDEPFMNELQLEYFRRKLEAWKQELQDLSAETLEGLQDNWEAAGDAVEARRGKFRRWLKSRRD